MDINEFKTIANNIRKAIVIMNARANASHSGSALSIVDILVVLYFKILKINPQDPSLKDRDVFILSKGHASTALYATLSCRGFFDMSLLEGFYIDGGILPGHLDKDSVPGIEVSSGSLGHGLSLGLGMAINSRIDKIDNHIYILSGDGELNEGSMWEAIMFSGHKRINNLTLIIDYNKLQGYGKTNDIINLEPLSDKFTSFGWYPIEVDGHNYKELEEALLYKTEIPKVIIAHTIKGKGVSYMENEFVWHYKSPNNEELENAINELNNK